MIDLKALRERANLTQEKLAKLSGVERTTISMIETGNNKPSIQLAKKLGEILNCQWTLFFNDDVQ